MALSKTNLVAASGGAIVLTLLAVWSLTPTASDAPISASALRQMEQLLREKDARRPAPRGIAAITPRRTAGSATGWTTLARFASLEATLSAAGSIGTLTSEGDVAHAASQARMAYGVTGAGVRVGVLSDSADAAPSLIRAGALPAATTIVQDLMSGRGTSKGTAMMEIVHALAPDAQLFFASGLNSPEGFALNIRVLRFVYRCDIIVDDVVWSGESPFEPGAIGKAVNEVTASGATYISAAGEKGNLTNRSSSTWEGDFRSAGPNPLLPGYLLHDFGGVPFNRLTTSTTALDLFWSDATGASGNDYDLFVLNAEGTEVIGSSTAVQDGDDDPFEEVFSASGFPANSRVVIAARAGAAARALHLSAFLHEPLAVQTAGAVRGHNALPSVVTVAAVAWNSAHAGGPFTGGARNPTEVRSADGARRMFYGSDGAAITPGNLLFATAGGSVFVKPDIAAADGVTVRTPGFSPFFGAGAAAAHAAGIAALIKSARPSLTAWEIREAMTSTALDIMAPGIDRDSGYGIVMTPAAIAKALQLRSAVELTARTSEAAHGFTSPSTW